MTAIILAVTTGLTWGAAAFCKENKYELAFFVTCASVETLLTVIVALQHHAMLIMRSMH